MYARSNNSHEYLTTSPSAYRPRATHYDCPPQEEAHSRFQTSGMAPSDTTPKKRVIHDRLEASYGKNNSMQISGK